MRSNFAGINNIDICVCVCMTVLLVFTDDPDKGDHSDVILGAALSSLFIFGLAFGGTYFLVYRLRHTEKYIELHKYEFDQEDLLESYAEYAPTAADEEL